MFDPLSSGFDQVLRLAPLCTGATESSEVLVCTAKYCGIETKSNQEVWLKVMPARLLLKVAIGAGVAVAGGTVGLPILGFSSAGVASGSIAAGIQSMIGNVAAGSAFASMQSAGVVGLGAATKGALATGGAIIAALL